MAVNPDTFSLHLSGALSLCRPLSTYGTHETSLMQRIHQGLMSLCLSLKVRPHVRYQVDSSAASKVGQALHSAFGAEKDLFTFGRAAGNTLLVGAERGNGGC